MEKERKQQPSRPSDMEPAEGSRETVEESLRHNANEDRARQDGANRNRGKQDLGTSSDRAMYSGPDTEERHGSQGGGISNRDLEREHAEQDEVPARGRTKSEEER